MTETTLEDWSNARAIEKIYHEQRESRAINHHEFIEGVPDLPHDRPVQLFLIAGDLGISVNWLKTRYFG